MFRYFCLAVIIGLLSGITLAFAQDEATAPTCDDAAALAAIYSETLAEAATLEDLQAVQAQIAHDLATCQGLVFEGEDDTVIGPVEIPAGIYKTLFTTLGYGTVKPTTIDGECGIDVSIFNVTEGRAAEGAEAVFKSDGCRVLLEVSNVSKPPYTLEFQLIQ